MQGPDVDAAHVEDRGADLRAREGHLSGRVAVRRGDGDAGVRGVHDALEVGLARTALPAAVHELQARAPTAVRDRDAARARGEVRADDLPVVGGDLAARGLDRGVRGGLPGAYAR